MSASFTAPLMALERAFESVRPTGSRRFDDPLAVGFLSSPRRVAGVGEPWTFGFPPETLGAYLANRGLELVWDRSTAEAGTDYLQGRPERASELYQVALGRMRCPD